MYDFLAVRLHWSMRLYWSSYPNYVKRGIKLQLVFIKMRNSKNNLERRLPEVSEKRLWSFPLGIFLSPVSWCSRLLSLRSQGYYSYNKYCICTIFCIIYKSLYDIIVFVLYFLLFPNLYDYFVRIAWEHCIVFTLYFLFQYDNSRLCVRKFSEIHP